MRDFLRQLDIINPREIVFPVTIIGVGGIGRHVAETLAEMGFQEINLYDSDIVEEHNRPNQAFRKTDIGKKKVKATKEIIEEFAEDCKVNIFPERFKNQEIGGIVISGVDTMESRKEIWQKIRWNIKVPLYIDGRIGGEIIQIYTVRPCQIEDIERYEKNLFPDEEGAQLPCTAREVIYIGKIISGLIAIQVKKWLKQERYSQEITFDAKTMSLILESS